MISPIGVLVGKVHLASVANKYLHCCYKCTSSPCSVNVVFCSANFRISRKYTLFFQSIHELCHFDSTSSHFGSIVNTNRIENWNHMHFICLRKSFIFQIINIIYWMQVHKTVLGFAFQERFQFWFWFILEMEEIQLGDNKYWRQRAMGKWTNNL